MAVSASTTAVPSVAEVVRLHPVPAPIEPAATMTPPTPTRTDTAVVAEVEGEVVPSSERCPKCATPKNGRDSCARCGVVFSLYKPESDAGLDAARPEFARLLAQWDDPEAKKQLARIGPIKLGLLARLNRHHLADFPNDARAQALLEALTQRSMALAMAVTTDAAERRTPEEARSHRWVIVGAGAMLVLVLGMIMLLIRQMFSSGFALR